MSRYERRWRAKGLRIADCENCIANGELRMADWED
jgi:hypothetical protein